MKTFLLTDGDLVVAPGGYATVDGPSKVKQDLSYATTEPYGCDRFHPRWGSLLESMIGAASTADTTLMVRNEVNRVIQNYATAQADTLQHDAAAGHKSRYAQNEIVSTIGSIQVAQDFDTVHVRAFVRTLNGDQVSVSTSVAS